ncbi:right-handed parallel beta-helix repeat-containing protein [Geobacillus jurassicus]|uniref:Nitrous oxide reductase family maturation protein NosD n=1 Tax=Geobacillus jurassicus TaxID=235932 RepID=A0ABV6GQL4_9BACL|nr:NosD domain-containing protein [Geobacillus jurassicus]
MRRYADHWLLVLLLLLVFPLPARAEETVQARIDEAPEYGVVRLASGVYDEAIVLSKPLALEGIGEVTIRSCRKSPVIAIYGRHVVLKNIRVVQCGDAPDMPAIYVTGHDHTIDGVRVLTNQQGVKLDHAHHTTIVHCAVQGEKNGNGIDLWESTQNVIHYTAIERVKDGIYMENSHNNVLSGNHIDNARYGIHVMFSNRIVLRKNISEKNIAGAMVMGTEQTTIEQNSFVQNKRNVHSQGLLLYDAAKTIVRKNRIAANRVGIYVEQARHNELTENDVSHNFIGMQWNESSNNRVSDNSFIGNVYDAQAIRSPDNTIVRNYWDAATKLDVTGKGVSAIPYRADPFFLALTVDVPEYQLFFQSPGMIVLQKLLRSPDEQVLTDDAPLMEQPTARKDRPSRSASLLYVMSAVMIAGSISGFIIGRKRP